MNIDELKDCLKDEDALERIKATFEKSKIERDTEEKVRQEKYRKKAFEEWFKIKKKISFAAEFGDNYVTLKVGKIFGYNRNILKHIENFARQEKFNAKWDMHSNELYIYGWNTGFWM